MRLIINFNGEGLTIPYDHTYSLYSALLRSVSKYYSETSNKIHDNVESYFPKFCMSQLLPGGKRKMNANGKSADRFILLISSLDKEILDQIADSLTKDGQLMVCGVVLNLFSVKFEENKVSSEIVTLITRSPVILKNNGDYITSRDEIFNDVLLYNINRKIRKVIGDGASVHFTSILAHDERLLTVKGAKIPASQIKFTIGGDIGALEAIVQLGIGSKTQIGFGYIEEEPHPSSGGERQNGIQYKH